MRTLYLAFTENVGETEGMFDSDGTLLDFWSCNDACYRSEYFNPFMNKLGYNVEQAPDWMVAKLELAASEAWGVEIYSH